MAAPSRKLSRGIIHRFGHSLFGSEPAEFVSAFALAESVERLQAAAKRWSFSVSCESAAVGNVSEMVVRLQRVIPMVGNSFTPFFIGRFEGRGAVTVLAGRFTMLPLVKGFMCFWLGVTLLIAVLALIGLFFAHGRNGAIFVIQPLLMTAAGIGIVLAASGATGLVPGIAGPHIMPIAAPGAAGYVVP